MSAPVQIELLPLGQVLQVGKGDALQDALFRYGVEFPCGGRGRCKGCKIRILSGSLAISEADASWLSPAELNAGWRLACQARAESNLRIELAQWEAPVLSHQSSFSFNPRPGLGVTVDIGTTTIVAQLLDLSTGQVLAVRSALNDQARHGADIMSRVELAISEQGQEKLEILIRNQVWALITELLAARADSTRESGLDYKLGRKPKPTVLNPESAIESIVLVGNTVMHHLFSGVSVELLAHFPFDTQDIGLQTFSTVDLGWNIPGNPRVVFLPCLGGFVGSDLLAGVLATKLHERDSLAVLIDLGTNGEIVLGNRDRLLCAATAAGPAFEGARISMGMRAATGAISAVHAAEGRLHCHVLGSSTARGICGSGLVDAVATALELGWIQPNGRLVNGESIKLADPVFLTQRDIRELQLAKGAIAAGVRLLLEHWGARLEQVQQVFLAGAFGNYINQANARRIGLLRFSSDKIVPVGNTALHGAKLALFHLPITDPTYRQIISKITHLSLSEMPGFQEVYAEEMSLS